MASSLRKFPAVKPIPDGFHTITPYVTVEGVPRILEFLKKAFDAKEVFKMASQDGTIRHAELQIGDSMMMLGEPSGEWKSMPCALYVYVSDVDAVYRKAIAAGASSLQEPRDEFYGDRNAGVRDFAGNVWWIATHVEDVPPDELERRASAMKR